MVKMMQGMLDAVLMMLVGTQPCNFYPNDLQLGMTEVRAMQLTHYAFDLAPFWTNNVVKHMNGTIVMVVIVVVIMAMVASILFATISVGMRRMVWVRCMTVHGIKSAIK